MESDGGTQTRITSSSVHEELGDWSPDGIWLVFSRLDDNSGDDSKEGLWLRNPDGVNLVQLTKGQDSDPAWSPNGRDIAFVRTDGQNSDIYTVSKVKVSAEDGTSTQTYTVTVTRDDFPNDNTTTGEVDVGGSVTGNIETFADGDWFAVELEAGTRYQIDLEGRIPGAAPW